MKKIFAVFVLFLLLAGKVFSGTIFTSDPGPDRYFVTVWGGIANTNLSGERLPIFTFGPYNNHKLGLTAGGSLEMFISKNISIEAGVFYNQSGGQTKEMVGMNEQGDELGNFWFEQDIQYLDFPISIKMNHDFGNVNSFLLFGPNLGVLLSAEEKFKSDYDNEEYKDWNENIENDFSGYNLCLDVGVGINYPLSQRIHILAVMKYSIGVINQIKNAPSNVEQKSRDLKFLTGLSFSL